MGIETVLRQIEDKPTLELSDYVRLRKELENIDARYAEILRDDIWHRQGKWQGVGLGYIPTKEIIKRVDDIINGLRDTQLQHEEEICRNCKHALLRSEYSFNYYGGYDHLYECMLVETTASMYKRVCDTCNRFEPKEG